MNEATIKGTILAGALEPDDVARRCGAGAECGGCRPAVLALIDELCHRETHGAHSSAA